MDTLQQGAAPMALTDMPMTADGTIDTLDLERHMTLEHVIDIRHAHHQRSMTPTGPALAGPPSRARRGEAGRGA